MSEKSQLDRALQDIQVVIKSQGELDEGTLEIKRKIDQLVKTSSQTNAQSKIVRKKVDTLVESTAVQLETETAQNQRIGRLQRVIEGAQGYVDGQLVQEKEQSATFSAIRKEKDENLKKSRTFNVMVDNIKEDLQQTQTADKSTIEKVKWANCLAITSVVLISILVLLFVCVLIYVSVKGSI